MTSKCSVLASEKLDLLSTTKPFPMMNGEKVIEEKKRELTCRDHTSYILQSDPVEDHDEQHRCMGLNSHGVSKVRVIDTAGVKQVEQ